MKPIRLFLLALTCIPAALAQPLVLNDGAYQLIRAREPIAGEHTAGALSAVVVNISNKQGKAFMTFEGVEAEVRTDDQLSFLVTLPYRPEEKGRLACQIVLAGRPANNGVPSPSKRIEGVYRIIWARGEEKGEFALYPLPPKNG
jgi:hypothetical protein